MGFSKNTQATRSTLMSVDSTLAANIDATQDYIPIASTTNFSTSVVAEIETTNEVVSFDSVTTNLFLRSQEFDNAYWGKSQLTVTANAGVAPDGTTTADKIIQNAATSSNFVLYRSLSTPSSNANLSVFAKAAGKDYLNVIIEAGTSTTMGVQFNLASGTIAVEQHATGTITDVGSGWYRCSATPTTSTVSGYKDFQPNDGGAPGNYFFSTATGNGSDGVLLWGAQVESSNPLTGYLPTTSASLSGLTTVTRGVNGTTAALATSGDAIQQLPYALSEINMPTRLKAISVSSDGTGVGRLTLCDKIGTTLLDIDIPDTSLYELDFGDDRGIIFPNGIYVANSDNLTAYTLFTDKYSGGSL